VALGSASSRAELIGRTLPTVQSPANGTDKSKGAGRTPDPFLFLLVFNYLA